MQPETAGFIRSIRMPIPPTLSAKWVAGCRQAVRDENLARIRLSVPEIGSRLSKH